MKKLAVLFSLLSFAACDVSQLGEFGLLSFNDQESLEGAGGGRYAVGDEIFLAVSFAAGVQPVPLSASSSDASVLSFDGGTLSGGRLLVHGTALGDGEATLEMRSPETNEVFDQITLRAATATGVEVTIPGFLEQVSLDAPVITLFERSQQSLTLQPRAASGETLKGQLSGEINLDPAVASLALGSSLIGSEAVLRGESAGASALSITASTFSQELPVEVVPFSEVALSTTLFADKDGVVRGTGSLRIESLLPDGRAVLGGVYEVREACIQNLAGSCLLDEQLSLLGDVAFFGVIESGVTTLEVRLLDQEGVLQQSTSIEITVEAQ